MSDYEENALANLREINAQGTSPTEAVIFAAVAQVCATLAVNETLQEIRQQLRIANLARGADE